MELRDFIKYAGDVSRAVELDHFRDVSAAIDVDSARWFENNIGWLRENWILNNTRAYSDINIAVMRKPPTPIMASGVLAGTNPPIINNYQMQVFITERSISETAMRSAFSYDEQKLRIKKGMMDAHINTILRFAVFGKKIDRDAYGEVEGRIIPAPHSMSGFVEQKGRLPRPGDKVEMAYLEGNAVKRWLSISEWMGEPHVMRITSECCLIAE